MKSRLNLLVVTILMTVPCFCFAGDIALVTDISGSVEATYNNSQPWTPNVAETIQEGTRLTIYAGGSITLVHLGLNQEVELKDPGTVEIGKQSISGGKFSKKGDLAKLPSQLDLQARHMEEGGGQRAGTMGGQSDFDRQSQEPLPSPSSSNAPSPQAVPSMAPPPPQETREETKKGDIAPGRAPSADQGTSIDKASLDEPSVSGEKTEGDAGNPSPQKPETSKSGSQLMNVIGHQGDSLPNILNDQNSDEAKVFDGMGIPENPKAKLGGKENLADTKEKSALLKSSFAFPSSFFAGKKPGKILLLKLNNTEIPLQVRECEGWVNFEFNLRKDLVGKSFKEASLISDKKNLRTFTFEYSLDEQSRPLACAVVYEGSNRLGQAAGVWISQMNEDPKKVAAIREHLKRLHEKILKISAK